MGKNFSSKIIAFLFALIIWITVYNIYDPVITTEMKNIEVSIINESALTSLGKVYNVKEGSRINFYIKGKQSIVNSIKRTDIKATADLSRLSDVNAVKIDISIPSYNREDISIIYGDIDTLKVVLDNYVTKSFKIYINPKNKISDKYYLRSNNASNIYMKISGPQQEINRISEVYIEPNLEDLYPKYSTYLDVKAKDSFGSDIDLKNLELDTRTIKYTPTVLNIKEIPINIELNVTVPFGYELISEKFSPKKIKITGTDELLKNFNNLNIDYNINDLTENKKVKIDLDMYMPENLFIVSNNKNVELSFQVEQLEIKKYSFSISDIILKNMPESMVINYLENSNLYIEVMGNKDIIGDLEVKDILPYVDFSELSLGKHSVKINSLNENLKLISSSSLNIELKEEIIIIDNPDKIKEENSENIKDVEENIEELIKEDVKDEPSKEDTKKENDNQKEEEEHEDFKKDNIKDINIEIKP